MTATHTIRMNISTQRPRGRTVTIQKRLDTSGQPYWVTLAGDTVVHRDSDQGECIRAGARWFVMDRFTQRQGRRDDAWGEQP